METRANYVIVGIFTLVAILAAFGFVYWTAAIGDRGETTLLRVRIPGSASGLGRGSFVLFNGVKVGDVKRVYIDVDNPTVAIADTEIDRMTPITKSTQADIGLAGLTGQANIELKGADPKEVKLLDQAEKEGKVAEIIANPSAVTNLLQTAQNIFTRADKVLTELEGFTKDVRGPLTQTVQNVRTFSDALARNSDGIDKFLSAVSALSDELKGVSGKLDGTLKAAEGLLNAVDKDKIKSIVANVDTVTGNLKETSRQLDGVIKNVDTAVGSVNDFAKQTQGTLAKVDGVLDGIDPAQVRQALANIQKASDNANKAAADIAEVTGKIANRADDIDQTIKDARQLAQRLNDASVRVDG
ncbi:MAG: MCE family protein, partial [Mesorhizobium sp.]